MTTPEEEQAFWDLRAAMPEMWSEPDEDAGVNYCMGLLLPVLEKSAARQSFLDLGCGIGRLTIPVALAFPEARVVGVDISPKAIARAQGSLSAADNIAYYLGDGRTIPISGPISGGWSFAMLHHIPAEAQLRYLTRIVEMLDPGGRFLFQVTQGGDTSDYNHPISVKDALLMGQAAKDQGARLQWEEVHRFPTWLLGYLTKGDP